MQPACGLSRFFTRGAGAVFRTAAARRSVQGAPALPVSRSICDNSTVSKGRRANRGGESEVARGRARSTSLCGISPGVFLLREEFRNLDIRSRMRDSESCEFESRLKIRAKIVGYVSSEIPLEISRGINVSRHNPAMFAPLSTRELSKFPFFES